MNPHEAPGAGSGGGSGTEPTAASGRDRVALAVGFPPGLAPDKWLRRMAERFPVVEVQGFVLDLAEARVSDAARLLGGTSGMTPEADISVDATSATPDSAHDELGNTGGDRPERFDVVFVRESSDDPRSAPLGLARIPLYDEAQSVLVPKDHEASLFASLSLDELDGERWVEPVDPLVATSAEVQMHVELVAANVGLGQLPLPLARAHSRRDVVVVPLDEPPSTRVGIAWLPERGEDEAIAGLVGIVQGRTANSSRGPEARSAASETEKGGDRARDKGGAVREKPRGKTGRSAAPRKAGEQSRGSGRGRPASGARRGRSSGRGGRRQR
ncbi:LysR family transcriptional regulator substrate-binding protein [Dietzia sp.]|uniref:LysR family transcriptional regulator substrate-binding protein n=1 Tax=Dietzia sp. TaxID=1871616 RepID=UPI002FD8E84B